MSRLTAKEVQIRGPIHRRSLATKAPVDLGDCRLRAYSSTDPRKDRGRHINGDPR